MKTVGTRARRWRRSATVAEFRIISTRFARYLVRKGYSLRTVQHYRAVAQHFGRWLGNRHIPWRQVSECVIGQFRQRHLPQCYCPRPSTSCPAVVQAGLRHLLKFLRFRKLCPSPPATCPPRIARQLRGFDRYSREVRGLAGATRRYDRHHIRQFLEWRFGRGSLHYEQIKPTDLANFLHQRAQALQPSTMQLVAGSLRRFLRYLLLKGKVSAGLEQAILVPAMHRSGALPKVFTAEERMHLLEQGFDRRSEAGRRDYAMVLCQLELGLRACEVAALTLEDLDWRGGVLLIRKTKSRRERRLPLLSSVGRALSAYLRDGRPHSVAREVFLRHVFPKGNPLRAETVRVAMREAYRRAGLSRSWTGTHVLRRTFASRLHQSGTGLKSIADLLGHQCPETTTVYTRIDLTQLRRVALPWPKLKP